MKAWIYQTHKKLSLVAGVLLLLWICSGLLHPLLTYVGPRPAVFQPPEVTISKAAGLAAFQKTHADLVVSKIRFGAGWGQVTIPGQAEKIYFDAQGKVIEGQDKNHAIALARHYMQLPDTPVASAELQTEFDRAYPPINRLLPVWRVNFATPGHLSVYVDTGSDRYSTAAHDLRRVLLFLMQNIHTLSFLDSVEGARLVLIACAIMTVLSITMLGMGILVFKKTNGNNRLRYAHALLGWVIWVPILMFGCSGLFHLVRQSPLLYPDTISEARAFKIADAGMVPDITGAKDLRALANADSIFWREVDADKTIAIYNAAGEKLALDDAGFAASFTSEPIMDHSQLVTRFNHHYAFSYKRLPVWGFMALDNAMIYIDPLDGVLSARVQPTDMTEHWTFSTFHKWQFLDPYMGKGYRDAIMIAFGLGVFAMAVMGLALTMRRR